MKSQLPVPLGFCFFSEFYYMRAHFSFYAFVALLGEIIHGNRPSLLFLDSLFLWCWVGFIGVFFSPFLRQPWSWKESWGPNSILMDVYKDSWELGSLVFNLSFSLPILGEILGNPPPCFLRRDSRTPNSLFLGFFCTLWMEGVWWNSVSHLLGLLQIR